VAVWREDDVTEEQFWFVIGSLCQEHGVEELIANYGTQTPRPVTEEQRPLR
jgi:hypothetical protein